VAPNPAYPNETFERLKVVASAANEPAIEVQNSGGTRVWSITGAGAVTPAAGVGPVTAAPLGQMWANGLAPPTTTTGTDTTPVSGTIYVSAVFVPCNATLTGVGILNGSAAANSAIVSLYSSAGVLLANSALAGTAQSGTAAIQKIAFTATEEVTGPDTYFVAVSFNGTSARFRSQILGVGPTTSQAGVFGTLDAISSVPTTFTTNVGPICALY
jgi:hypothetical protein